MFCNFLALLHSIRALGPVRGDWPNYGKLRTGIHHCHIQKGHPTYVMVWKTTDREKKIVEVVYAGTHEKADYKRFR
ncbi:MAG TPA: cytotoxic translational repressor of toxin-antitoxin stability system [Candidatus Ozemobacteraceae bacterium]|nr:cytotoxic translational repressor of toxin-antitoxin stability system [Candidatus Ozemobacteraceae bacterium]